MGRTVLHKNISRLMALLLALLLLAGTPVVFADGESGSCGDQLTWSFHAGTLTVSGSGDMTNYSEGTMAPWYAFREEILRLELPKGLTSVGTLAFYGCKNLTAVSIPDSVKTVGGYAFAECSGMKLLSLGSGVNYIGECAFSDCRSLAALRLPQGLQTIGKKAFYRCESVTAITVPASVQSIGVSAFAYCKNLVSADIRASVEVMPEYVFYGCEKLTAVTLPKQVSQIGDYSFRGCDNLGAVYYGGTSMSQEELRQQLNESVSDFEDNGYVGITSTAQTVTSSTAQQNEDGSVTQENITVSQSQNATVSSNVSNTHAPGTSGGNYSTEITVDVENEEGWAESAEGVEEALKNLSERVTNTGGTAETVEITVYFKGEETVDQTFIDALAGRDVTVTVVTRNGSSWKIDCSEMNPKQLSGVYDLRYTLLDAPGEKVRQMNVKKGYLLKFSGEALVNAELLIQLSGEAVLQNATLFQQSEDSEALIRHQTVLVDQEGCAHFYLGSITAETDYYIGLNVPGTEDDVIIPDSLLAQYGVDYVEPVEYVITGRRPSSWGMEIGQVTWILAGVMVGAVVIVGFVMFQLNKRRLKNGYVPPMED